MHNGHVKVKLDGTQLAFLERFKRSPDCQALVEIFKAELTALDLVLRTARGDDVFRAQGAAEEVDSLIKTIVSQPTAARAVPVRQTGRESFV